MKLFFLAWAAGALIFFVFALIPGVSLPAGSDKIAHTTIFFALMLFPVMTVQDHRFISLCAVMLFVLGGGVEVLQGFVPGREPSMDDMLANSLGIVFGCLSGTLLRRKDIFPKRFLVKIR